MGPFGKKINIIDEIIIYIYKNGGDKNMKDFLKMPSWGFRFYSFSMGLLAHLYGKFAIILILRWSNLFPKGIMVY